MPAPRTLSPSRSIRRSCYRCSEFGCSASKEFRVFMSTEPTANMLIVDDDPKTLVGMEALLAGPGRKIVTVSSAQYALRQLLRHEEFSLILLDVRMPDMDGFETAEL